MRHRRYLIREKDKEGFPPSVKLDFLERKESPQIGKMLTL
jgi:hypothetical protein